jgi:hypothetical protein
MPESIDQTPVALTTAVCRALRREFPELRFRESDGRGVRLDDELGGLIRWLVERIPNDERLAGAGATRIADLLLHSGFPRRALLRAVEMVRVQLVSEVADRPAVHRVMDSLSEALSHRLMPEQLSRRPTGGRGFIAFEAAR